MVRRYPSLEIGAGSTPKRAGWINADYHPGPTVDVAFDATKTWPFKGGSIGLVQANHVLEHLPEPFQFFREAWRVLVPSQVASLYVRVPFGPSEGGFGDMTHIRYFTSSSFACLQPGYGAAIKNPQYGAWDAPFEVVQIYKHIDPAMRHLLKPGIRRWGVRMLPWIYGGFCELIVGLRPLKNGETVASPGAIPITNVMYEHEYRGVKHDPNRPGRFLFFGAGSDEMQRLSDAKSQQP